MAGNALTAPLPVEWEATTLGEIVKRGGGHIQTGPFGSQLHASDYVPEGVPSIMPVNIGDRRIIENGIARITEADANRLRRHRVQTGDIIYSRRGDVERCALVRPEHEGWLCGTGCLMVRFGDGGLNPRFAAYYLSHAEVRAWIVRHAVGATMPNLNTAIMEAIPFVVPPPAEQQAIACILGTLDDKIELNRRMCRTLEGIARAIFKNWFVDFDPVRAKLYGRKPAGLDAATATLFPAHFQDSPLGHIPQGWTVTTLGACIGFRSGFSFKSQDWQESGVPVVKIGSVKPGIIDLSQVSYVSDEIAQQAARYRLSVGDMLIGMTGYVGEVGLVPPTDNLPLLNQRVGKFVLPNPGTESLPFWYCTTRQPEFRAFVEARSHGTAQANVSAEAILEFPLMVPPDDIFSVFNVTCRPMFDQILSNHVQSRTLATLRDTLLPKLISGELGVPDAERIAGRCA